MEPIILKIIKLKTGKANVIIKINRIKLKCPLICMGSNVEGRVKDNKLNKYVAISNG
jgi:hypothetical protein